MKNVMKTYALDPPYQVWESSRITIPGSETADTDEHGYLVQNGTQRRLAAGFDTYGALFIWLETNGGPVMFSFEDDFSGLYPALADLGDAPQGERDRVEQGARRMHNAVAWLRALYQTEEAQVTLDWYETWANNVLCSLSLSEIRQILEVHHA